MFSKFLHSIDKIIDFIVFVSWFMNALLLWLPIVNNAILNYLVFGFRNIKVHILNVVVIFLQILLFVYMDSGDITIAYIIPIPWLIYMISSILYFRRESRPVFYSVCVTLMLFAMWVIYSIFIYGSHDKSSIIIGSCNCTFGLILLISNIYISNNRLANKYLKYTTILINLAYTAIVIYCFFSFAMNPDIGSL